MIRRLIDGDSNDALLLSESASWNQDSIDWSRLIDFSDCFGVEVDGRIVASIGVTCYGKELAWIGMVLTLPQHRGQGHASNLMRHAMDFALGRNIACIKLDATDLGAPVYRKFGFEDECAVERWRGGVQRPDIEGGAGPLDYDLDRAAFGADRQRLLDRFESSVAANGFACRRGGRTASHFGPCVARDLDSATPLAAWGASRGPAFWDLFPGHPQAVQLAHSLGFTPARKLLRMSYRGRDVDQDPSLVYALAGFEWG